MKNLKFRSWDKSSKSFSYFTMEDISMDMGYFNTEAITQFTGLLDKEGIPIYEGDIVEDNSSNAYKVVYRRDGYQYESSEGVVYAYIGTVQWVIIGNIYENPELLSQPTT